MGFDAHVRADASSNANELVGQTDMDITRPLQLHQLQPPLISPQIDNPRATEEFESTIPSTYIFALAAYAHLLSKASKSNRYYMETIELIGFAVSCPADCSAYEQLITSYI